MSALEHTRDPDADRPMIPDTMTAVFQRAYGTDARKVFDLRRVRVPDPMPDQVLVRVAASSVNALDHHYMTGTPSFLRLQNGLRTPKRRIPGADVAGTVVVVGDRVTDFAVGDEVFGEIDAGGFAEYAVADPGALAHAPASLPIEVSATLGVAALTALQGLRDWAGMQPGDKVLVNGASGGVGTFAVQVARALGAAHVSAVCSTPNVDTARSLGADRVVDYTADDFTALDDRFDVFFDNAGSKSLGASRRMLVDDGVLVMVTGRKGRWIRPVDRLLGGLVRSVAWSQQFANGTARPSGADGAVLAGMVDAGTVRPVIERRFDLDDAVDALAHQARGHARAKTIVVVA